MEHLTNDALLQQFNNISFDTSTFLCNLLRAFIAVQSDLQTLKRDFHSFKQSILITQPQLQRTQSANGNSAAEVLVRSTTDCPKPTTEQQPQQQPQQQSATYELNSDDATQPPPNYNTPIKQPAPASAPASTSASASLNQKSRLKRRRRSSNRISISPMTDARPRKPSSTEAEEADTPTSRPASRAKTNPTPLGGAVTDAALTGFRDAAHVVQVAAQMRQKIHNQVQRTDDVLEEQRMERKNREPCEQCRAKYKEWAKISRDPIGMYERLISACRHREDEAERKFWKDDRFESPTQSPKKAGKK